MVAGRLSESDGGGSSRGSSRGTCGIPKASHTRAVPAPSVRRAAVATGSSGTARRYSTGKASSVSHFVQSRSSTGPIRYCSR
jgi:hypothetical protein